MNNIQSNNEISSKKPQLWEIERDAIYNRLLENSGNVEITYQSLGIARSTLYLKMKRYGIDYVEIRRFCREQAKALV